MNCWSVDSLSRALVSLVVFRYWNTMPRSAADTIPRIATLMTISMSVKPSSPRVRRRRSLHQLHGFAPAVVALPLHGCRRTTVSFSSAVCSASPGGRDLEVQSLDAVGRAGTPGRAVPGLHGRHGLGVAGGQVGHRDARVAGRGVRAGLVAVGVHVGLDRLGEAAHVGAAGRVVAVHDRRADAHHEPAEDGHRGDAEDRDGDDQLDQGLAAVAALRCSKGGHVTRRPDGRCRTSPRPARPRRSRRSGP